MKKELPLQYKVMQESLPHGIDRNNHVFTIVDDEKIYFKDEEDAYSWLEKRIGEPWNRDNAEEYDEYEFYEIVGDNESPFSF